MSQNLWRLPTVQTRGRWWMLYRLAPFAAFLTLTVVLFYLVWQPFFHPRLYLLFATAEYPLALLPPHSEPGEDLAAIRVSQAALVDATEGGEGAGGIASPAALDAIFDHLDDQEIRRRDVLVAWIGAQVVSERGRATLLCGNFDPMDVPSACYPLARLLERVRACPSQTKVIVLDSGATVHSPRLGLLADCSVRQLRAMVEETKDPSLWVVLAHSDCEPSCVMAEPHQSAIAHFFGEGLQGAADSNGDRLIDLGELYRYTRDRLADWIRAETGGRGQQTTVLLWGGGQPAAGMSFPVVLPTMPPKVAVSESHEGGEGKSAEHESHEGGEGKSREGGEAKPAGHESHEGGETKRAANEPHEGGEGKPAATEPHMARPPARSIAAVSSEPAAASPAVTDEKTEKPQPSGEKPEKAPEKPEKSEKPEKPEKPEKGPEKTEKPAKPETTAAARTASDPVLTASAAELQGMAWSLHDRLAAAPEFRVIDNAPQFWRALQDRLVTQTSAAALSNGHPPAAMTAELRRMVRQMSDMAAGRTPQSYQQRDLLPLLAQWTQPVEVAATWPTLAMAERLARPVPADLVAAANRLDQVADKPDASDFKKWIAELPSPLDACAEIRFARRLATQPELDWASVRLALKARRLAEQAAAETLESGDWIRPQIERGDRFRLAGERSLLTGVRTEDASQAVQWLQRAIDEYSQADAWNRDLVALRALTSEALFCLPGCLHWFVASIPDTDDVSADPAVLEQLIGNLEQDQKLFDHPAASALPDVRRQRHELETLLAALHKRRLAPAEPLKPASGDAAGLPATGLVAAQMRLRLIELPDLSAELVPASGKPPAIPLRRDSIDRLRDAFRLNGKAVLLLLGDLPETDKNAKAFAAAARFDERTAGAAELCNACDRLGEATRDLLAGLPETIQFRTVENQDLTDPAQRDRQVRNLRAAQRLLYLVHPWDADRMEFTGPPQLLARAELYDLLVWQQRRIAAEIADADPGELAGLVGAASNCRRAAAEIPQQPPPAEVPPPGIEIRGPSQVDLANKVNCEFAFSVTNRLDRATDVWLAADYDARTVALQARDQAPLYDAASVLGSPDDFSGATGSGATNGGLDARAPTLRLQPGETKVVWLQLHRKTLAGGDARVSLYALTKSDRVRRELTAALPHRFSVDMVADGIADSWQSHDSVLTLYPYPNRATPFSLSLVNAGPAERMVDLEILRVANAAALPPPRGDVDRAAAQQYLAGIGPSGQVLKVEKITLAAGGRRVPIPFAPPGPPAAQPAAPAPVAAGAAPAAPAAAPTDKMPPLSSVLLALIADRATGRCVIKRLEILTQRPARYIRLWAEYDPERRRADIVARPVKRSALPPDGVWLDAQPAADAGSGLRRSGAWLRPAAPEATFHVEVPPDSGPLFSFFVNVDGFDRAFRYEVPVPATSRTPLVEAGRNSLRILDPRPGTCYGPKPVEIPVSLQVDAPHGLLFDGNNFVEVGVDTNRDRELRRKEALRLTSDRQVDLFLEGAGADGSFTIRTKVSELHVLLPPPKIMAMRADIIARLALPTGDVWSPPIEVVFDDEPPRLSRLQLDPGATVTQGSDLEVSVLASDNDLSGVAKVEAAFDLQRKGEFADPPLPASVGADGRWSVKLPTKPLLPGVYGLLVRATNRVGNASEYLKATVEVVPPGGPEVKRPVLGNLAGRVVYGRFDKRPVEEAAVQLLSAKDKSKVSEATTDDQGRFTMADLPPGDYKLTAEKLLSGNRRVAEMDVKVPVPPAAAEPVEVILITKR